MTPASLRIQHLFAAYQPNQWILQDISMEIPPGKFVGILGPSGCGKTTLLRILAGLDRSQRGEIWLGDTAWDLPEQNRWVAPERRNIGMVFQTYALWPHMTVFENLAFSLRIRKITSHEISQRIKTQLNTLNMVDLAQRYPHELSGGQQQRVALARALLQEPQLLLMDEPLSNLDRHLKKKLRKEIKELQKTSGVTTFLVTHDWEEAEDLCDHLIVLNRGLIEQEGRPQDIRSRPASDFVLALTES